MEDAPHPLICQTSKLNDNPEFSTIREIDKFVNHNFWDLSFILKNWSLTKSRIVVFGGSKSKIMTLFKDARFTSISAQICEFVFLIFGKLRFWIKVYFLISWELNFPKQRFLHLNMTFKREFARNDKSKIVVFLSFYQIFKLYESDITAQVYDICIPTRFKC